MKRGRASSWTGILGALALALVVGCAPRPLVERAIRARGGPVEAIVREAEADVEASFAAGRWRWRTAFMVPDRFAWTIHTTGDRHHYLFDGRVERAFVGDRLVTAGVASGGLRSLARFTAVSGLDALRLPGARVAPVPAGELPPGASAALDVVLLDDGARYRLVLDDRLLVVSAAGPVELPTLGRGPLVARFSEFARTSGRLLARRTQYVFRDEPLADERALAVCPDPPHLDVAAFSDPTRIPRCPGGGPRAAAP